MKALTVLIKPASSLCNMRCRYCFYHDIAENRQTKSFGIMSNAVMCCLIDRVFEYVGRYGKAGFAFQGGEPTLCGIEFYQKFTAYANQKAKENKISVSYSIQTNGLLIDDSFAELFSQNRFLVGLSLDGTKEIHDYNRIYTSQNADSFKGSFDRVQKAANLLKKYKVDFNILCVVTEKHSKKATAIYNFYKKNDYKYLQFIPCISPLHKDEGGISNEGFSRFLEELFNAWYLDFKAGEYISIRDFDNIASLVMGKAPEICTLQGHCRCNIVIESNGNAYPCDFYVLDEYYLGNINEKSIAELMENDVSKAFIKTSFIRSEECDSCEWLFLCRTGCRRYKEPLQTSDGKNYFCKAYKQFFKNTYSRWQNVPKILSSVYNSKL